MILDFETRPQLIAERVHIEFPCMNLLSSFQLYIIPGRFRQLYKISTNSRELSPCSRVIDGFSLIMSALDTRYDTSKMSSRGTSSVRGGRLRLRSDLLSPMGWDAQWIASSLSLLATSLDLSPLGLGACSWVGGPSGPPKRLYGVTRSARKKGLPKEPLFRSA